jgi:hypothetical protein
MSSRRRYSAIHVHIDELTLESFSPQDRYRIADAVERELTRLFAAHQMPQFGTNGLQLDRLDAGSVRINEGANPSATGAHVARALFGQIQGLAYLPNRAKGTVK